jgi:hypothetical protein
VPTASFIPTCLYEFKEIKGGNPPGSIKAVADQYVVSFLNSEVVLFGVFAITTVQLSVLSYLLMREMKSDE